MQLDVVRQEAFLPVEQLLGGDVELLRLALTHRDLSANNILQNQSPPRTEARSSLSVFIEKKPV